MSLHQKLVDEVLCQIVKDVNKGDLTAIEELLKTVNSAALTGYLPEEVLDTLQNLH